MKLRLRDLFLSPEALNPGNNPLVRLGALHHLRRISDKDQVRQRLEGILKEQDIQGLRSTSVDASTFALHVAVALAQEGSSEGVEWLLRYLRGSQKHQQLAFTALRNCRQFPLAVLLGSAVDKATLEASYQSLGDLAAFSEEQAWTLAESKNRSKAIAMVSTLESALHHLKKVAKLGSHLALGTVITAPLRKPVAGLRYTGFLIVEEVKSTLRAIPYTIADLINRDDGAAKVIASDLLREPGRRVIVAYDSTERSKAKVLYVLPFGPPQDAQKLLEQAALSCEGISVGVIVHRWETHSGWMYRFVTASGQTEVGHDHTGRMTIGTCSLVHKSSTRPFFTRFTISQTGTGKIFASFVQNTALERATLLNSWENGHKLAGQTGRIIVSRETPPDDLVVFLESKLIRDADQTFVVKLPPIGWLPEHRSAVLQDFFAHRPDHYAVVVALLQVSRGVSTALIINRQSSVRELRKAPSEVRPGTLVFWDLNEEKVYTTYLTDQLVVAQCDTCFDTGSRVCGTCDGTDRMRCSQCGGTGKSRCNHCDGTGIRTSDCRGCKGKGDCGNCGGSATVTLNCKICEGTGRYADSGRLCKKCSGAGTFSVPCRVCTTGPQPRGKCPNCKGSGEFSQGCKTCVGTGRWNCNICHTKGIVPCVTCRGNLISRCECGGTTGVRLRPVKKEAERGLR